MPVNSTHPLYQDRIDDWRICRLFYQGERAVKKNPEAYIPKPEGSTKREYENYVLRAFFFPAMERTVSGLSGAIDRKEPTIALTPALDSIRNNFDGDGNSIRQITKIVLDEVLITGRVGLLGDRLPDGSDPYVAIYKAEDIINWHEDPVLGFTMVVLREEYFQVSGEIFNQKKQTQYRLLLLDNGKYIQRLYKFFADGSLKQEGEDIVPSRAGQALDFIPFVIANIRSVSAKIDKPPLLDLAMKNAEHLRVSADYANSLYYTGNPILVAKGIKKPARSPGLAHMADRLDANEPDFNITLGSNRAVRIGKDSDLYLVESKGHGVNPNKERCDDIKLEMAVIGARILEPQRQGVESAETAQLRQSGESSALSNVVINVSEAMRKILEMLDKWQGGKGDGVKCDLNNDFIEITMNPQLLSVLKDTAMSELISWDTFYYNLSLGELTVPGRTPEEELAKIRTQGPIGTAGSASAANQALANQNNPPISNNE